MDSANAQSSLRWRIGLILVMVAVWVFGLNYARLTPFDKAGAPFGAVESGHLKYVRNLTSGKGLPDPEPTFRDDASGQPPLYYIVTTAYAKLIGLRAANHDPSLDVKYRSVGVLFAVLALFGIYRLAFQTTDDQPLAVLATGAAVLTPAFCSSAGILSNETAAACLCAFALAGLFKPNAGGRALVAAGIWTGLAIETHSMAATLLVPWIVRIVLDRGNAKSNLPGFAVAILVALPAFLRNLRLSGDPFGFGSLQSTGPADMLTYGQVTLKSAVGSFGSQTIFLPDAAYIFFVIALLGAGVVGLAMPKKDSSSGVRLGIGAWLIALLAYHMAANMRHFEPSGAPFVVGAAAFGFFCAIGWRRVLPNDRAFQVAVLAILTALIGLNAYAFHILPEHFAAMIPVGS